MILNQETIINKNINELKNYMTKNKKDLFILRVQERLDKCLVTYYKELTNSFDKLYSKAEEGKEIKILNYLNKS